MAFPTLTRKHLPIKFAREDNIISNSMEAGYENRRARFTRVRRTLTVPFDTMDTTDRDAIITHFNSVGMAMSFTFTDNDSNSYIVYYNKPIEYTKVVTGWWKFEDLELREV